MPCVWLLATIVHRIGAYAVRCNLIACLLYCRIIDLGQIHVVRTLEAPVAVVVPAVWLIVIVFSVEVTAVGIASVVIVVLSVAIVVVLLIIVLLVFAVVGLFPGRWRLDRWRRRDSRTPCQLRRWLERCCSSWCGLWPHWDRSRLLDWLGGGFLLRPALALLSLLALSFLALLLLLLRGLFSSLSVSTAHIWRQLKLHVDVSSIKVIGGAKLEADLIVHVEIDVVARQSGTQKVVRAIVREIRVQVIPLVGMRHGIVSVDASRGLRRMSVVVRH